MFLPISRILIFTPLAPTSIPAYTAEFLYFKLNFGCPNKNIVGLDKHNSRKIRFKEIDNIVRELFGN